MASKFTCLKNLAQALAKEIAEFNEDKKDVAETKVRLVREESISKLRRTLSKRVLKSITIVENTPKGEMSS